MLFQYLLETVIHKNSLKIVTADGMEHTYGDGTPPCVTIKLHRKSLEWALGVNPELKIGEAYVDGLLTIEEGTLSEFLYILLSNYETTGDKSPYHWREQIYKYFANLPEFNPIKRAQENAEFHYDMPDQLYRYFLDSDRQYSCAYFRHPYDTLEQAQVDKKRHIASKLHLNRPGLRVLDIGSGWGGLGLYLAAEANCWVKGVTLSVNQYKMSRERSITAGLESQCSFVLRDYRNETGPFDRIVSIGMFEHVGKRNYGEFFGHIKRLLANDGVCLLHTIGRYGEPKPVNAFIHKHIFPGSDLPTLAELCSSVDEAGLYVTDVEALRLHYAETLRCWIDRLRLHRRDIERLFGEDLYRKWEFYLTGSELGFRLGHLVVFQVQISKALNAVPVTRDYMFAWERAHMPEEDAFTPMVNEIAALSTKETARHH